MAIQSTAATSTSVIAEDGGSRKTMRSTVSSNGAARIASMVVNMYADPVSAVTREYIANAVDATIAAGSKSPVHVTVPTVLSPTLVVKDNGTGMDAEALERAFLAFAESTKGNTNDQVGGLGVGAKSAWTICESFIVDTVKDGKRNIVRASRDLEHEVMLSDADTDTPNGTTVTIPVKVDDVAWREEILKVAAFHKQGAVIVDGKSVDSIQRGKRLGPVRLGGIENIQSRFLVLSGGTMFGVPTTLTSTLREALPNLSAIIELPVGSFSHTPNRDFLIADDRTKAALKAALKSFTKSHDAALKRLLKMAEKDLSTALHARAEYLNGERSRKILPMPYEVDFSGPHTYTASRRGSRASVWSPVRSLRRSIYELDQLHRTVVVTDVPHGKVLKGIGRYMDTENPFATIVVAVPEGSPEVEFKVSPSPSEDNSTFRIGAKSNGVTVVKYDALMARAKELSAMHAAQKAPLQPLKYPVLSVIGGKCSHEDMTLDEVDALLSSTEGDVPVTFGIYDRYRRLTSVAPSTNFVVIDNGRRSTKPIVSRFPDAIQFYTFYEKVMVDAELSVSDEDVARFILTDHTTWRFVHMSLVAHVVSEADGVPEWVSARIKKLAGMHLVDTSKDVAQRVPVIMTAHLYRTSRVSNLVSELDDQWKALTTAYPLLEAVSHRFLNGDTASIRDTSYDEEKMRHILGYVSSVAPVALDTDI